MDDTRQAEESLRHDMAQGEHAKALQENPLLQEALAAWDAEIVAKWADSPLRDVEGRERLRLMLEASKAFRAYLTATAERGAASGEQLRQFINHRRSIAQQIKDFMA